jgi:hypothetical protein
MWNALRVLLHRPLVADGQLHMTLPSTSKSSFAACTEAAMNIVKLVRLYDRSFSMGRAPYLMPSPVRENMLTGYQQLMLQRQYMCA